MTDDEFRVDWTPGAMRTHRWFRTAEQARRWLLASALADDDDADAFRNVRIGGLVLGAGMMAASFFIGTDSDKQGCGSARPGPATMLTGQSELLGLSRSVLRTVVWVGVCVATMLTFLGRVSQSRTRHTLAFSNLVIRIEADDMWGIALLGLGTSAASFFVGAVDSIAR